MDHVSVMGRSDPSDYGDDEDEEPQGKKKKQQQQQQQEQSPKIPIRSGLRPQSRKGGVIQKASVTSFAPERANPEIDAYLLS